jgi:hypothetical protein
MTTRERWIVYPLLFLAIGLGLRSGLILQQMERHRSTAGAPRALEADVVKCNRFECQGLTAGAINCNALQVLGRNGTAIVALGPDTTTGAGLIETRKTDGKIQSLIVSEKAGASINLFSADAKNVVELTTDGETIKLISADLDNRRQSVRSSARLNLFPRPDDVQEDMRRRKNSTIKPKDTKTPPGNDSRSLPEKSK